MRHIRYEQSKDEFYTSHAGLGVAGYALKRFGQLDKLLRRIPLRHGISHKDLLTSYLGLLLLGKNDFDAIHGMRHDTFFKSALGIKRVPSAESLRLRMRKDSLAFMPAVRAATLNFLRRSKVRVSALETGHVPLDIDAFPMDNSGTKKEGVSWTYKGFDGYLGLPAYLGEEGWCLALELREGKQHSNADFEDFLVEAITRAGALTAAPLLVRMDSGNDAESNRLACSRRQTDYLIKWNPRGNGAEYFLELAESMGVHWETPREGKRVALFSIEQTDQDAGRAVRWRKVIRVVERTVDRNGQRLILPELTLDAWCTSLFDCDENTVVELYKKHATCEQYHSEIKTDLDLERLPSGCMQVNDLIMHLAGLAYNVLRWIGLNTLIGKGAPLRHPAKRRRLKTVMQEIMYLAARLVSHGRRLKLRFSRHCPAYTTLEAFHRRLCPA